MKNKYIIAEEHDFEIDESSDLIYIGNYEGIEYIDITDFLNKFNLITKIGLLYFACSKSNKIKGVKNDCKNIKKLSFMFEYFKGESLDLSEFNTEFITHFDNMFSNAEIEELNISNFKTYHCENFYAMFYQSNIRKLDLRSFFFKRYFLEMDYMFANFKCDELILPDSFPINFDVNVFINSKIETIKTPSKKFYEKNKEWFKDKYNTELILIS